MSQRRPKSSKSKNIYENIEFNHYLNYEDIIDLDKKEINDNKNKNVKKQKFILKNKKKLFFLKMIILTKIYTTILSQIQVVTIKIIIKILIDMRPIILPNLLV